MVRSSWRAPALLGGAAAVAVAITRLGFGEPAALGLLTALSWLLAVSSLRRRSTVRPAGILLAACGLCVAVGTSTLTLTVLLDTAVWARALVAFTLVASLTLASIATAVESGALLSEASRHRALLDSFVTAAMIGAATWNLIVISGQQHATLDRQVLHVTVVVLALVPTAFASMGAVNDPTDHRFNRLAVGFAAAAVTMGAGVIASGLGQGSSVVEPLAAFSAVYVAIAVGTRSNGKRPGIDVASRLQRRRRVVDVVQLLYLLSLSATLPTSGDRIVMGGATVTVLTLLIAVQRSAGKENVQLHRQLEAQLANLAESEDRFRRLAWTDELTGLMNRRAVVEQLRIELARANRCAVLFVDLDRFKEVNDTLGHDAGDELLGALAGRITVAVGPTAHVARFGGDEFVVVISDSPSLRSAVACGERILAAIAEPVELRGIRAFVAASIGIARASSGATPVRLLSDADTAMYEAKSQGRNRIVVYSRDLGERTEHRMRMANDLHRGIEAGELVTYFQPIVELATGRARGFEALVRWEHPERGLMLPGEFLEVAEDTGLIVPLGAHVLRSACEQLAAWRREGLVPELSSVSVNLAPRQLSDPELVTQVIDVLTETGLTGHDLVLEITESSLMSEVGEVDRVVAEIGALGVLFSVDDFGTGYSSLTYLKRFPVHVIKVDREFVDGLPGELDDRVIVDAVVGLAAGIGVRCVAEGVETEEQAAYLQSIGCEYAQGYLFGRPMPAGEISAWLAAGSATSAGSPLPS